jgi:hypothetical protein
MYVFASTIADFDTVITANVVIFTDIPPAAVIVAIHTTIYPVVVAGVTKSFYFD